MPTIECMHERMQPEHDYCPDCGELRTSWLLEGAKLRASIAELEAELERVKRAAINGMNAATAHGHGLVEQAARLRAESNPDALESERAANAMLTEQLQQAEAERDALRADAERYRWLREKYTIVLLNGETEMRITHGPRASSKSGIDDVIDAARGAA